MHQSYHSYASVVMLVVLRAGVAAPLARGQEGAIDSLALRSHTYFLAHDALEGRAAGTKGELLAAHYITAQCMRLGLAPVRGGYLHPVPLEEATILAETRLTVSGPLGVRRFDYPAGVVPNVGQRRALSGFRGAAYWVRDDSLVTSGGLGAADLGGAVAVTAGSLDARAHDTLMARGVTGTIQLTADGSAYDLYRRSRGDTRLYHGDSAVVSSLLPALPSVIAGPEASAALVGGVRSRASLERPGPLSVNVAFAFHALRRAVTSYNVSCHVPGTDASRRDTAIVLTAHYDHLGFGPANADGDSLYNGFSDNAVGVAMLLAIGEALVAAPARYSVVLLFFGAEERGLLGSDHYVGDPAWPLERVRAVINLDAGAPPAPPASWRLQAYDTAGVTRTAIAVAADRGWAVATSAPRPNSDHYPFVRRGVPALFVVPGPGAYEGLSEEESNALRRRWDRYHDPDDEWHADFPFSGLQRYATYALAVLRALDR